MDETTKINFGVPDKPAFDAKKIELMVQALLDAWTSLSPEEQATTNREAMVRRILIAADAGERDPLKLRTVALTFPPLNEVSKPVDRLH